MAVVSCKFCRQRADAPIATFDERNRGNYTLSYEVQTNSLMSPRLIANACLTGAALGGDNVNLPALWTKYIYQGDSDATSYSRNYRIYPRGDNQYSWRIDVEYRPLDGEVAAKGTITEADLAAQAIALPWQRPPIVWWDREVYSEVRQFDRSDKPIINKAGRRYPQEVYVERTRSVLVVEYNMQRRSEVVQQLQVYSDSVNAGTWEKFNVPPRAALCREITAGPPITDNVGSGGFGTDSTYYRLVYRFALAPLGQTWDHEMIEEGYEFNKVKTVGDNGEPIVPLPGVFELDIFGEPVKVESIEPVLLDVDGGRLLEPANPDTTVIKTSWRVREERDFNTLPFMDYVPDD